MSNPTSSPALAALREYVAAGHSATSIARDLGVAQNTALRWVRGEREPRAGDAARLELLTEGAVRAAEWA